MSDIFVWSLLKKGHGPRAMAREIPGFGLELRYYWDEELRQSKVFRSEEELAAAANAKRDELFQNGWMEVPKTLMWGN